LGRALNPAGAARRGETAAFWALLFLSVMAFALVIATPAQQWPAIERGDASALSHSVQFLLTAALLSVAWLFALAVAIRYRRWGWLIAAFVLPVSIIVFAIVALVQHSRQRPAPLVLGPGVQSTRSRDRAV
jgi:hypothetical protein